MSHVRDREGRPSRPRRCRVCGEAIAAGELCHIYTGVEAGDGFYTLYFHPECWEYSRAWDEMDWETCGYGAVSRSEVRSSLGT